MDFQLIWDWLFDEKNRQVLSWLGGGGVIVVGGLWAVIKYMRRSKKLSLPSVHVSADHGGIAAGRDVNLTNHKVSDVEKQ
jgi:hypothetical protein